MGTTISSVIFYALAVTMAVSAIMSVTVKKMSRAVAYLLFVLVGTAGLYLLLNYHFLAAVQLSVYAGGILVLFVFTILLTRPQAEVFERRISRKVLSGAAIALVGLVVTAAIILKTRFLYTNAAITGDNEINMSEIGTVLTGTEKYQYLLAFEVLSVLLLACIIGGIVIARKKK